MKCIDEVPAGELKGKRVFLRTSLNLPILPDGTAGDIFRLTRGLPTIQYLVQCGARVVIAGYLGRKGDTMRPVAEALIKLAPNIPISFFGTSFEQAQSEVSALKNGECLVLESTRRDSGEEANSPEFAGLLASLADIFVSDAFAEAHRNYASNVGIAKLLPSYAGLLLRDEVAELTEALHPPRPSLAIVGGAKFETKDPVIRAFLEVYDHVCVVGAIANDCLKGKGFPVGRSRISEHAPAKEVCENPHLIIPTDVTAENSLKQASVKKPGDVLPDDKIVDIGPDTVATLAPYIAEAKFITWNGPTGIFEEGYISYTTAIAELIARRVEQGGLHSVIGGGDTISALKESGIPEEKLGFFSTGGGAMLEFLLKGTLPGIAALG